MLVMCLNVILGVRLVIYLAPLCTYDSFQCKQRDQIERVVGSQCKTTATETWSIVGNTFYLPHNAFVVETCNVSGITGFGYCILFPPVISLVDKFASLFRN